MHSHHVGDSTDSFRIQHDDLSGHVTLHGLSHVLDCAVDGRVFDLKPVVCVPAYQEPHMLLPVELLLEHLQHRRMKRKINYSQLSVLYRCQTRMFIQTFKEPITELNFF